MDCGAFLSERKTSERGSASFIYIGLFIYLYSITMCLLCTRYWDIAIKHTFMIFLSGA